MSNEELAVEWLGQRPEMDAVVFFGEGNEILVTKIRFLSRFDFVF